MLNPDTLCDALRDKLRAIPALVTLMANDPLRIVCYVDSDSGLLRSVNEMQLPSMLIAWQEMQGQSDALQAWTHRLSIFVRYAGRFGALLYQVTNGVPTGGDGRRLTAPDVVHPDWEMVGVPTAQRVIDDDGTEYFEIGMTFAQKVED